jgi:hypothetical protein
MLVVVGPLELAGIESARSISRDLFPWQIQPKELQQIQMSAAQLPCETIPPNRGGLAICLVVIVAVLAVIVRLRPARSGIVALVLTSGRVAVICAVPPDGPSLAELCLLRT